MEVSVIVSDQGQGFDPSHLPDPLAVENLSAEHGRGIHLMKLAMDEVSFERGKRRFICEGNWAMKGDHAPQHFAS
jgi:anti-sigma regulatory factor (Ser/Thr protein kinase)